MTHRCLLVPKVVIGPDPTMVTIRVPYPDQHHYLELTLLPAEADKLGLDLLLEARRAKEVRAARKRLSRTA